MAEENESQKAEVAATPSSNQNLIIGIVMGAVVLLLLLLVISQQFNKGDNSDVADLRKKLKEQQELGDKLRLSGIAGVNGDPEALVAQIKSDTEALASLVNASESDAAQLRIARADASRLSAANEDLRRQRDQYSAAASRAQDLQRQLELAQQASAGMVSKTEIDRLRAELETAKADRDRIQSELTLARTTTQGMVDAVTHARVVTKRDELTLENIRLRNEILDLRAKLDGAKLFVTKDDLSPRAIALYRALKKIESDDHRGRRDEYAQFSQTIKANVRESISFKTGKAQIASEHEAHIKDMMDQADPGSFFLVVGYASTLGDSQGNEELSSRRATRVASMVNYHKKQGHGVQAVYLGEGKRFGPEDAPNQVCEVWEIRP